MIARCDACDRRARRAGTGGTVYRCDLSKGGLEDRWRCSDCGGLLRELGGTLTSELARDAVLLPPATELPQSAAYRKGSFDATRRANPLGYVPMKCRYPQARAEYLQGVRDRLPGLKRGTP